MMDDRIGTNFHQRPVDNGWILPVGGNTVKTAKKIERSDHGANDCK
jgi:hypothetical protein